MLHPDLFALARNLLELAADAFARNSSNDYTLPDLDPEARKQLAALDAAEDFDPEAIVNDWQIMLALARGLSREGGEIQQFIWDTNAAKETAVQQERAAVVEVVIEYATACGMSLEGLISGLTPAALVRHALHHALWAHQRVDARAGADIEAGAMVGLNADGLVVPMTRPVDFAEGVTMVGELISESAAKHDATIAKIEADTRTAIVNEITAEAKRIADEEGLDARVNALMAMARKVASRPAV